MLLSCNLQDVACVCSVFVQTALMKVCLFVQRRGLHLRTAGYRQQRKPVQDPSLPSRRPGQTGRGISAVEMLSRDAAQRPGVKNRTHDININVSHSLVQYAVHIVHVSDATWHLQFK